ncbi:MAG: hypothetical protein GXO54_08105 [Chloroflexi bacterium]|nr:hypothetical protein [Chloroflexota bacterium]
MADQEILQQLQWLDQERRKDRSLLLRLQDRLMSLEGQVLRLEENLKETATEISRLAGLLGRFDVLDEKLAQLQKAQHEQRQQLWQAWQEQWEPFKEEIRESLARLQARLAALEAWDERLQALEDAMEQRREVEDDLLRRWETLRAQVEEAERRQQERLDALRLIQENYERTLNRLIDLQGEVSALRKRLEAQASNQSVFEVSLRQLEKRVQAIQEAEEERRREQRTFLEAISRQQAELKRTWQEWEQRLAQLTELRQQLEKQLQAMFNLERDARQHQRVLEEMRERLERRIHEITEMQRLAEERFRQEWAAFKADDQKRWTNYLLAQEEQQRELNRHIEALRTDLDRLQHATAALEDRVQGLDEQTQKRLQSLLRLAREWVEAYERYNGAFTRGG